MKKKRFLFMVVAITVFSFMPFVKVHAEGETLPTITKDKIVLLNESTVYAGEVFVDGQSQMQWLYSSDISNRNFTFGNLKAKLYGTNFYDLVPTLDEDSDNTGLAVSSDHQSEMNSNWTSASYVAHQYFSGSFGGETNEPLNNGDEHNRFLTPISFDSNISYQIIDGVLTRVMTLIFYDEETTVNYTKIDITSTQTPTYTVTFDANNGSPRTTQSVTEGEKAIIPEEPTKDGYEFYYWESNNGASIYNGITSDTIFTARWLKVFNFIEGQDQTFYLDSDNDITIVTDGPFDDLDDLMIFNDNKIIYIDDLTEGKDYILEEGSTKLTLKNSFLKTLDADNYYVSFSYYNPATYGNGYADTTLSVKEGVKSEPVVTTSNKVDKTTNNPQTGDNILVYASLLGLSIIGLLGSVLYIKKNI